MGRLVTGDGHNQGWLATLLCCGAAVKDDEQPLEKPKFRQTSQKVVYNDQRISTVSAVSIAKNPHVSGGDAAVDDPNIPHNNALSSEKPPSLQPPDLGANFVRRRPQIDGRTSSIGRTRNPSMTGPGLIPLRLAPVVLSESLASTGASTDTASTNHTRDLSASTRDLVPDAKRQSYREQRVSPFERCQRRSSAARGIRANLITPESGAVPAMPSSDGDAAQKEEEFRLPSMKSMHQPEVETTGVSVTNGERRRLKRKQSLPSVRKSYTDSGDLNADQEMLELYGLIDERRKVTANPSISGHHVPTVAPQVNRTPMMSDAPEKHHRLSATKSTSSRTSSRVSGWLSNLLPTNSTPGQSQEPFYKCVPPTWQREESQASLCTSTAELESPSLTSASSPTSYSHRRSLTADSRMIATSTTYGYNDSDYGKDTERQWPMLNVRPSQVGLAL